MSFPPALVGDRVEVWGTHYRITKRRESTDYSNYSEDMQERMRNSTYLLMRSEADDKLYWTYQYDDTGLIGLPSPAPFSDHP